MIIVKDSSPELAARRNQNVEFSTSKRAALLQGANNHHVKRGCPYDKRLVSQTRCRSLNFLSFRCALPLAFPSFTLSTTTTLNFITPIQQLSHHLQQTFTNTIANRRDAGYCRALDCLLGSLAHPGSSVQALLNETFTPSW